MKVIASLIDKKGFHKSMKIPYPPNPIITIPIPEKINNSYSMPHSEDPINITTYKVIEFYLERYKEIKQRNKVTHIVAIYKEY